MATQKVAVWYIVSEGHEDTLTLDGDFGEPEIREALWKLYPFAQDIRVEDFEVVASGR